MGKQLGLREFVALIALLFALIALGTDMMLPALGLMAHDLGLADENRAQLIITVFLFGTGLGQLVSGPMSDAYGRKLILGVGILLFVFASVWAAMTSSFTMLLIARFVQGLGISAPRAAGNAMVRDLYSGRQMARVISLAMMIFVLAPAVAPLMGQAIMIQFGWRAIFTVCMLSGVIAFLWMLIRQQETLAIENRLPFTLTSLISGYKIVFTSKRVVITTLVQSCVLGGLFAYLSSAHQVYSEWLDSEEMFPIYFCGIALMSSLSNVVTATLVERVGMWVLSAVAIGANAIISILVLTTLYFEMVPQAYILPVFVAWSVVVFFSLAMCIGNLMSLAMEPVGDIAGLASSIIGSTSTMLSIGLAIPIGMMFNGTGIPLIASVTCLAITAFTLHWFNPRNV